MEPVHIYIYIVFGKNPAACNINVDDKGSSLKNTGFYSIRLTNFKNV